MSACLDLVHPADRAAVEAEVSQAVAEPGGFEYEYRIVRRDGEVRWIYARATVEPYASGRPLALRGICQDITDRKIAAEVLERQASLLDLLRRIAVNANESTDLDEALCRCLDDVCSHAGWEIGRVQFVDDDAEEIRELWSSDVGGRFDTFSAAVADPAPTGSRGLLALNFRRGQPIWGLPFSVAAGEAAAAAAAATAGLVSAVAFPILVADEVVAVLEFFSSSSTQPDRELIETLANGTSQLGRVIERARAQAALSHRVLHDPLTGLANRTLLLDRLAHALEQRSDDDSLVAIILSTSMTSS